MNLIVEFGYGVINFTHHSRIYRFSGGMETLFEGKKEISLDLPETICTIQDLLFYIRENHIKGHPELFMQGKTMYIPQYYFSLYPIFGRRPGVLILINEADWELEGGLQYTLSPGDRILFISTLHGG